MQKRVVGAAGVTPMYCEKIILEVPSGLSFQCILLFGMDKLVKCSNFLTVHFVGHLPEYLRISLVNDAMINFVMFMK